MKGRRLPWLLLGALFFHAQIVAAEVLILRAGDETVHHEAVTGLQSTLPDALDVRVRPVAQPRGDVESPTAVLAVGTHALQAALQRYPDLPIFALLVPGQTIDALLGRAPHPDNDFGALYLDQPISRQARMARALFPSLVRFGSIRSRSESPPPDNQRDEPDQTIELEYVAPQEPPLRAITRLIPRVDAILAVSDLRLYNARTMHGILLASYRANVPIIGYSRAMVRAGALASAWLSPRQHGAEAGRRIGPYLTGERTGWPGKSYSNQFRIAVNTRVARSLGLEPAVEVDGRVFHDGDAIR